MRARRAGTPAKKTILVVDDDPHILEVVEARLVASGFHVLKASRSGEALERMESADADLMICDVKLPDLNGFALFEKIRERKPHLPVIFLTAFGSIPDAVRAVKAGAVEYLTKPFEGKELVKKIHEILAASEPAPPPAAESLDGDLHWGSGVMREIRGMVERVALIDVNVLILGESGVGKERVARMIHDLGPRRPKPFVVVDCGSTPTGLLESELFGHVKGAFTHAVRDKKGLIEAAHQGTLFLDEIGNIPPEMQMRLLRFLEDRRIRRVGDLKETEVDCRVVAATNADLEEDIQSGKFREDLYYRLRVVTITVPPLRDRREDIPDLAAFFVSDFCRRAGIPPARLEPDTVAALKAHSWPGNVRELKNALEGAVALCRDGILRPADLPGVSMTDRRHRNGGISPIPPPDRLDQPLSLEENEREAILRALRKTGGVQKAAAELLGISRRAIHYKIKKYGITPGDPR